MDNYVNREKLGFQDAVKEYFVFLVDCYGFRCESSSLYIVKYLSEKVYINIFHEKISYEIYFEIGIPSSSTNNELRINLRDIEEFYNVEQSKYYQASNRDSVFLLQNTLLSC